LHVSPLSSTSSLSSSSSSSSSMMSQVGSITLRSFMSISLHFCQFCCVCLSTEHSLCILLFFSFFLTLPYLNQAEPIVSQNRFHAASSPLPFF
jgi:hypothetical protein